MILPEKVCPMGRSGKKRRANQRSNKALSRRGLVRVGVVVIVLLVIFGAAVLLAPTNQTGTPADFIPEVLGAPRVAVAQDSVDFGDVKLDKTVEAVFHVRNVGDEVLRILDYEPPVELVEGC